MSCVITIKKTILIHFTACLFCGCVLSYKYSRNMIEYYLISNVFVTSREEWKSFIIRGTSIFDLDTEFT